MIYGTERAAEKLKLSKRQFLRLVQQSGIDGRIGNRQRRRIFSEAQLEAIAKLKKQN